MNPFNGILRDSLVTNITDNSYKTIAGTPLNILSRINYRYRVLVSPGDTYEECVSIYRNNNSQFIHKATGQSVSVNYMTIQEMNYGIKVNDKDYRLVDLVLLARPYIERVPRELFKFRYINQIMSINRDGLIVPTFTGSKKEKYNINQLLGQLLGISQSITFTATLKRIIRDPHCLLSIVLICPDSKKVFPVIRVLLSGIFGPDLIVPTSSSNYVQSLLECREKIVESHGDIFGPPGILLFRGKQGLAGNQKVLAQMLPSIVIQESNKIQQIRPRIPLDPLGYSEDEFIDMKVIRLDHDPDPVSIRKESSGLFSFPEIIEYLRDQALVDTDYDYGVSDHSNDDDED